MIWCAEDGFEQIISIVTGEDYRWPHEYRNRYLIQMMGGRK